MLKQPKLAIYLVVTILLTFGLSVSLQSLLASWAPPTDTPPNDNTEEPMTLGSANQTKDGGITSNIGFLTPGNIQSTAGIISGNGSGLTSIDADTLDSLDSGDFCKANGDDCLPDSPWQKNGTDIFYLNGDVGINSNAPSYRLDVNGTVRAASFIYSSDERFKENIKPLPRALENILKLEGVEYTWKDSGEKGIGLIAQEVEGVFPELVDTDKAGYKSLQYANLIAPLIEAIKEQQKSIRELEERIREIENN